MKMLNNILLELKKKIISDRIVGILHQHKKKLVFIMFLTLVGAHSLPGLSQSRSLTKADNAFNAGEYFAAIDLYKEAYGSLDKSYKAEILYRMAECYRLINQPLKAELWYQKAILKGISTPMAVYYLGEMQKMNQKYEEAKESFRKFKELSPNDARADEGLRSCDLAQKLIDNPNGYQVDNMKFFNSRQEDFAPAYANAEYNLVYFTSSRDGATGNKINSVTGQNSADIFVSRGDRKGSWSIPIPLGPNINTEFEEGFPSLSSDFKTLYFTRCKAVKNKNMGCQIYYSEAQGEDWGKSNPINIGEDSVIIAHPAISPDNLTLYFTSDMAGGQGGKDIWKVTRTSKDGEWGKPVNLGPQINTSGDEEFPYVHPDGTLYFSSNGLPGLGGLDIFKAKPQPDGSWKVENMGSPINSNADDFGITFQKDEEKGFFSSSRTQKGDADIFAFTLPPLKFSIVGVVKDEKTEQPLANANVKSISSDGITIDVKTDKNGVFRYPLKPSTDYVFVASHEGYLNGKERQTTKGLDRSRDFKITILLSSIAKPIELPNILYDFAKWDLRPESMVALDKLVETLNDNPNITIELMSHTDARGNEADNMVLSQKRAQSVVDYLIEKGIAPDRLSAKGYGKTVPKVVDKKLAEQYSFLKEGITLSEDFINSLKDSDLQEIVHQINRRTEFKVLSTDYKPKK
ncbi:MAG TPA: OmpA family protein [Bacteroidales bacterium]